MYAFLLQLTFMAGLGIVAFILLRAVPRVPVDEPEPSFASRFAEFLNRLPLHHVDDRINAFIFKALRRFRVVVLKVDNRLARQIDRVKKSGEEATTNSVQEMIDHVQGERE
jgi:hypothetical protein